MQRGTRVHRGVMTCMLVSKHPKTDSGGLQSVGCIFNLIYLVIVRYVIIELETEDTADVVIHYGIAFLLCTLIDLQMLFLETFC